MPTRETNYDLGLLESLGWKPRSLTKPQLIMESGAKHFVRAGVPVRSPKGAVGIAQVMPETGPEAAKLAGLPWDPKRFEQDPEYNLRLGDAYQGMLDKKFGKGTEAALAAYHQGPTTVERALSRAAKTGGDWRDHIGPKGQQYIGYKGKGGKAVATQPYYRGSPESILEGLKEGLKIGPPAAGETARYSDETPDSAASIATGADVNTGTVKRDLGNYQSMSQLFMESVVGAIAPIKANAQRVAEEMKGIAATKENLANDVAGRADNVLKAITPLQVRRQALLNRLTELDALSPFERRLKSMFNSDYDPRVLRGRVERLDNQITGYEETYREINQIRTGVASLIVDAEAADVDTLNAEAKAILADSSLMNQALTAIGQNIDASLMPLAIQNRLTALNLQQKNSLLGGASAEQLTQWAQRAQDSADGTLTIDGVQVTIGELQKASTEAQGQQLSFRSLQNSVVSGDLNMQSHLEGEVLSRMTADQIDEAMRNNGVYNGHQFPIDKLVGALDSRKRLDSSNVEDIIMGTARGQAGSSLHALGQSVKTYTTRVREMFGDAPPEYAQSVIATQNSVKIFMKGFEEAERRGVADEYTATHLPTIQSFQKNIDNQVTLLAKRWGGGKEDLTAVADAYLRGQPLNSDAAIKGLISMARGNTPSGSKIQGPALAALQTATAIVRQFDQPAAQGKAGDSFEAMLKGGSAKEKETEMIRRVQQAVSAVYSDNLVNAVFNDLPNIAKSVRAEDQPNKVHPFARVGRDDFIAAVRHGDSEGYAAVANKLGLTPQQAQKMFSGDGGVDSAEWQAVKKKHGFNDGQYNDLFEQTQALQMNAMLEALDANRGQDGFSPAKAFVDFIQRPEARAQIDKMARGYGDSGFGAFLVSNAAGGGFSDAWDSYAEGVGMAYTQLNSTKLRETISKQRRLGADPIVKADAVLAAMQITPDERRTLIDAARPMLAAGVKVQPGAEAFMVGKFGIIPESAKARGGFERLTYIINNHKFDDPVVERIRQKAARNWAEMSAVVDSVSESLK